MLISSLPDCSLHYFINKKIIFGKVYSWLTGGRNRRQDGISTTQTGTGTNTPYTSVDSTQLLNNSNPNSINHINPDPGDLNLWHLAIHVYRLVDYLQIALISQTINSFRFYKLNLFQTNSFLSSPSCANLLHRCYSKHFNYFSNLCLIIHAINKQKLASFHKKRINKT